VLTVCGRVFSAEDVAMIREIVAREPVPCRAAAARETCDRLGRVAKNGQAKLMSCRVAHLRLERRGLIVLPPPRGRNGNGRRYVPGSMLEVPGGTPADWSFDFREAAIRPVVEPSDLRHWNEAVARFHYLGYTPLPGAQMRSMIERGSDLPGVIGFPAGAWKVAPRDRTNLPYAGRFVGRGLIHVRRPYSVSAVAAPSALKEAAPAVVVPADG
jgi:hypothetical protein